MYNMVIHLVMFSVEQVVQLLGGGGYKGNRGFYKIITKCSVPYYRELGIVLNVGSFAHFILEKKKKTTKNGRGYE